MTNTNPILILVVTEIWGWVCLENTVKHNEIGFIEYNEKIFGRDDQVRLHKTLMKAKARGANFVLTNADHETVRELWKNCDLVSVERGSEMAGKTAFRGRTTELVVTSIK